MTDNSQLNNAGIEYDYKLFVNYRCNPGQYRKLQETTFEQYTEMIRTGVIRTNIGANGKQIIIIPFDECLNFLNRNP